MENENKFCPLTYDPNGNNTIGGTHQSCKESCAWYIAKEKCCTMVLTAMANKAQINALEIVSRSTH